MFSLSRWSGGLVARVGARLPLVIGPFIAAAGFALFMLPGIGGSYWMTFFAPVVVLGLGMTITVAPLTTTVMNAVARDHAGIASGINNAVASAASLLAIAILGLVMSHVFGASLDRRLAEAHIAAEMVQQIDAQKIKVTAIAIPETADARTRVTIKHAIEASFVDGFRQVMLLAALLSLASALSAWLIFRGEKTALP
jgi:hypothetical protein